jgi:hydrocephalus-inducing protein
MCHFNVELSDYLSAGRRHPDYTYTLPDDIRVIELFSKGLGQKTLKKFELINPTGSAYEVIWRYIGEGTSSITCETTHGLISSGKRSIVMFGYAPVSVKTVESLWEFQIPEQSIRVQFLFVGRIMPQ